MCSEPFDSMSLVTSNPGWSKRSPHAVFWDGDLFVVTAGPRRVQGAFSLKLKSRLEHSHAHPGFP